MFITRRLKMDCKKALTFMGSVPKFLDLRRHCGQLFMTCMQMFLLDKFK